ncbi:MAG: ComEC/Rec2 family competence protein, partial [Mycetocola sp.]
ARDPTDAGKRTGKRELPLAVVWSGEAAWPSLALAGGAVTGALVVAGSDHRLRTLIWLGFTVIVLICTVVVLRRLQRRGGNGDREAQRSMSPVRTGEHQQPTGSARSRVNNPAPVPSLGSRWPVLVLCGLCSAVAVLTSGVLQLGQRGSEAVADLGRQKVAVVGTVMEPGRAAEPAADPVVDGLSNDGPGGGGGGGGGEGGAVRDGDNGSHGDEGSAHGSQRPSLKTRINATLSPAPAPAEQSHPHGVSSQPPRPTEASVRAIITCPGVSRIDWGQTLTGTGRLTPAPDQPGVAGVLIITSCTDITDPPGILGVTATLRTAFSELSDRLPGDGGALLPGLAIGDDSAVDDGLRDSMVTSGLSHLTAVSGANCAVVVGLAMMAATALGAARRWRVTAGVCALALFVVLVTPEPSVLRAAVMALVVLIAVASGRAGHTLSALGGAIGLCLFLNPWLIREYGFLLSVASTLALVTLAGPLTRWGSSRMPRVVAAGLAVPLAAQLACQPIIVILDPALSVGTVPANILAAPAAPIATVLGLMACLSGPVFPWLSAGFAALAWAPSAWIGLCARTIGAMDSLRLPLPAGVGAVVFSGLLLACVVGIVVCSRSGAVRARATCAVLLAALCASAVVVALVRPMLVVAAVPRDWQIFACDVGQGDAVLVRDSNHIALVDTGPERSGIKQCLQQAGVDRLSVLVLSHFDADHVGGFAELIGRTDRVLMPPESHARSRLIADSFLRAGSAVDLVSRGSHGAVGSALWSVHWPRDDGSRRWDGNDSSVVLSFDLPSGRAVFLGDTAAGSQRALARAAPELLAPVAWVKVAHHGSADQDAALYSSMRAAAAFIGVGADNDYGHPRQAAMDMLGSATIVRSDLCGWAAWTDLSTPPTTQRACPADGRAVGGSGYSG